MDPCTVETGLLKKKPCGQASVTRCENCEQPLCTKHAVAQLKPNGLKSGKFKCKECHLAHREHDKMAPPSEPSVAPAAKKPAEAAKPVPGAAAAAPAAPAAKAAPKEAPKEAPKPADDGGALEFTPSKPAEKK